MACNCRSALRAASPMAKLVRPPVAPPTTAHNMCAILESEGNNYTVRVSAEGKIYLGSLPAHSALSASRCRGPFAKTIEQAALKLGTVFLSATTKARFLAVIPVGNVKLGYLREVLRTF